MAYRMLAFDEAFWRPSIQMKVANTNLSGQLGSSTLGARMWRLAPGQASTKHRHATQHELYVLLEGTGRVRIDEESLTVEGTGSAMLVDPENVRQLFNDTDADQLWLVVGAPPESANTLSMTEEELALLYPDGPTALPPELGGGVFEG